MHYNLTQIVHDAFLTLTEGREHVQNLHLVHPRPLQVACTLTPGF